MKNSTKTTVIIKSLDLQLKAIIENDLKIFRSANQAKNTATGKQLLAA